jgi:RNA polymerase sigma-70 factor (ECF subfamily)
VAASRDHDFGGELFREHGALVLRVCQLFLRDPQEAEDAAQQVFLNAHRSLEPGVRPLDARKWLVQIARNECRSRLRRAAVHQESPLPEELAADEPEPAELAAQHALVERLRQELAELPERQREALVMREFRGLSYDELAAELEVSGPAIESLLQRARRRLVQRLEAARRPLITALLAFESVRKAFARLLPGPGPATEAVTAGGAAAVVAKIAATSAVVVTVGAASGDVTHVRASQPPVVERQPTPRVVSVAPKPSRRVVVKSEEPQRDESSSSGPGPAPASSTVDNSGPGSLSSGPGPGRKPLSSSGPSDNSGPGGSGSSGSDNSGPGSSAPDGPVD